MNPYGSLTSFRGNLSLKHLGIKMIGLDGSVIAAIVLFILLIITLDQLLLKPLARVQAERESGTR
jgi:hypothetical protein